MYFFFNISGCECDESGTIENTFCDKMGLLIDDGGDTYSYDVRVGRREGVRERHMKMQ